MIFGIAFALLGAWVLGLLQVFRVGDLVHLLLLVGLMLLLIAVMKARDAAIAERRLKERSGKS